MIIPLINFTGLYYPYYPCFSCNIRKVAGQSRRQIQACSLSTSAISYPWRFSLSLSVVAACIIPPVEDKVPKMKETRKEKRDSEMEIYAGTVAAERYLFFGPGER
jgi:hypothetical protein